MRRKLVRPRSSGRARGRRPSSGRKTRPMYLAAIATRQLKPGGREARVNISMRRFLRTRWIWMVFILALLPVLGWLFLDQSTVNEMYPALDKLASIPLGDRWSKPEMMQIRQLGAAALPPLRRVLREKDSRTTHFLLWVKTNWPSVNRYYSHLPDPNKMTERRWTACQVLETLGPAAKPAVPELIEVIESKDPRDVNAGVMALGAAGIDADVCERLDESLEQGKADFGRASIIMMLGNVKPPSARTFVVLTKELTDSSPYISGYAAEALGRLGVPDPAAIDGLKKLQRSTTDDLTAITCSVALWQLQKDEGAAASNVFNVLERLLQNPIPPPFGGGSGGQGVDCDRPGVPEGCRAVPTIAPRRNGKSQGARNHGIILRQVWPHLHPHAAPSGDDGPGHDQGQMPRCLHDGTASERGLLSASGGPAFGRCRRKFPTNEIGVDDLIHDKEVGVRVYAARIHWRNHRDPETVVPVLADALDRKKYQSYYYPQILRAALGELGEIGAEARAARADVVVLTKDPDPQIAQLATDTLIKLGK